MKKLIGLSITICLIATFMLTSVALGAMTKVAVCHLDEYGVYHLINIAEAAFPAHVEHGDASPGEGIPGNTGYDFGSECQPVLNVSGTWTGHSGLVNDMRYDFTLTLDDGGTGTIVYAGAWNGTRSVTWSLMGTTLYIYTWDSSYWADATGTVTGTYFIGTGAGAGGQSVQFEFWR